MTHRGRRIPIPARSAPQTTRATRTLTTDGRPRRRIRFAAITDAKATQRDSALHPRRTLLTTKTSARTRRANPRGTVAASFGRTLWAIVVRRTKLSSQSAKKRRERAAARRLQPYWGGHRLSGRGVPGQRQRQDGPRQHLAGGRREAPAHERRCLLLLQETRSISRTRTLWWSWRRARSCRCAGLAMSSSLTCGCEDRAWVLPGRAEPMSGRAPSWRRRRKETRKTKGEWHRGARPAAAEGANSVVGEARDRRRNDGMRAARREGRGQHRGARAIGAGTALLDNDRHLGREGAELDEQPYVSVDYGYLAGDADPGGERVVGHGLRGAVQRKGAVIKLTECVDSLCSNKVATRFNGEPAIKQVAADGRREGAVTTLETSQPGDQQGHGGARPRDGEQDLGVDDQPRGLHAQLGHRRRGRESSFRAMAGTPICTPKMRRRKGAVQAGSTLGPQQGRRPDDGRSVSRSQPANTSWSATARVSQPGRSSECRKRTSGGSPRRSWTWRRSLPWDQTGRPRAEGARPGGGRDWEDKVAEAQLPPSLAGSGRARRVYLKHGDVIEHGLSESCPGCRGR